MSCAKTAESFETPVGVWTGVGPRNHVLSGARMPPIVHELYRDAVYCYQCSAVCLCDVSVCLTRDRLGLTTICTKTAESIEMPLGVRTRVGPRNRVLSGGPDPPPQETVTVTVTE